MKLWGFGDGKRLLGEQRTSAYSQRHTVCQTSRKQKAKAQKKEWLGRWETLLQAATKLNGYQNIDASVLPGRLHNPEISNVFNFFSSSATRVPRILGEQKTCQIVFSKWCMHSIVMCEMQYLLIWRWCCMTMFFSWMVSRRAVARDLRSEMDWGVSGKLQPFSSDSSSSFTVHTSQVSTSNDFFCRRHDQAFQIKDQSFCSRVWTWPCLVDSTPVSALLFAGFPPTFEFLLHSSALWKTGRGMFFFRMRSNKTFINPLAQCSHCSGEMFKSFC